MVEKPGLSSIFFPIIGSPDTVVAQENGQVLVAVYAFRHAVRLSHAQERLLRMTTLPSWRKPERDMRRVSNKHRGSFVRDAVDDNACMYGLDRGR